MTTVTTLAACQWLLPCHSDAAATRDNYSIGNYPRNGLVTLTTLILVMAYNSISSNVVEEFPLREQMVKVRCRLGYLAY